MKKLNFLFIALVTFSSIEAFSQDQLSDSAQGTHSQAYEHLTNGTHVNVANDDAAQLAVIAKLPMNNIHFQDKGAAQLTETRWEDSLLQKDSLYLIQPDPTKSMITHYSPESRVRSDNQGLAEKTIKQQLTNTEP